VKKLTLLALVVSLLLALASNARAEVTLEGDLARSMDVTYQVGPNNNVVGQIVNRSNREVDVTVEFKGYTADGFMTQGNPIASISHLGGGETVRFQCGGFFGMVSKVALIKVTCPGIFGPAET
jgi:hypothetical protein